MPKKIQKEGKSGYFKYLFLGFTIFFIAIRFFNLSQTLEFNSDQGRDFLTTWNIYTQRQVTLIGPPSEYTIYGHQFFFGPASYYVILPAVILGNGDVVFVSSFLILLNAVIFLTSLIILNKYIKEKVIVYSFALLYTVTPMLITYTKSYWNPYFMLPTAMLLVALLVKSKTKFSLASSLFMGFLFGIGLQFHYSFIFAMILGMFWMLFHKKVTIYSLLTIIGGFVVGFSPIILFELRNNFYNTKTFFLILQNASTVHNSFTFNTFYLISLLPFLFLFLSWICYKIYKINAFIMYGFFAFYGVWALVSVIFQPSSVLNYSLLKHIAYTIEQDNPHEFNIVDQLTGDNRAMALRYLLTIHGNVPLGVVDYPQSKNLYIYSNMPINTLLKHPVWEISSLQPLSVIRTQHVSNNIYLYTVKKEYEK